MKLVWCIAVLAFAAAIQATAADASDEDWVNDYDNLYDYSEQDINDKDIDDNEENIDKKVEDDIQEFIQKNEEKTEAHSHDDFGTLLDYQFEDNRSNIDEKEATDKKDVGDILPEEPKVKELALNPEDLVDEPAQPSENSKENDEDEDTDIFGAIWSEEEEDVPLPVLESNKVLPKEIQQILKENSFNESVSNEIREPTLDEIKEKTSKLLQEIDEVDLFSNDNKNSNDATMDVNYDDDTPEKVLRDLSADLDKLFETLDKLHEDDADVEKIFESLDKLNENDSDLGDKDDAFNDTNLIDDVHDYEEKYKIPGEGYIMSLRDDYDNFFHSNLSETFDKYAKTSFDDDDIQKYEQTIPTIEDNSIQTLTSKTDEVRKEETVTVNDDGRTKPSALELSSEIDYDALLLAFTDKEDKNYLDEDQKHYYGNDGLVDDDMPKNDDAEVFVTSTRTLITGNASVSTDIDSTATEPEEPTATKGKVPAATTEEVTEKFSTEEAVSTTEAVVEKATIMVTDLNSAQYSDIMVQFSVAHDEELHEVKNFEPPKRITLSADEATVITSPNHPDRYPRNTIVDWILEGPGIGIEMNMTALNVNGVAGDYVLVKPGGVDASGSDGLLFSFQLREVRRYRFTNVNRMFVRFESKSAMPLTGFSMSVKMILPPPEIESSEVPEPEAILHPPNATLTLSLAGLTLVEFHNAKSDFKELVADMSAKYIEDNNIDPGLNTTMEVTQITRTAVCNIRWPNYETCVEVTFGVPLHFAEEVEDHKLDAKDLETMWRTYIVKEPFASRLRIMGITEYAIPNDRSVLMVWLLIAAGVIIGMTVLGFSLWRFSCFEDYTRMKSFNDSDSIQNEKRNLDLYPTPHQTLPPLYTEDGYKWADAEKYDDSTRVDMGGFSNTSYIRDDLFDLDSDEDIITTRDRKGVIINSKDVFEA